MTHSDRVLEVIGDRYEYRIIPSEYNLVKFLLVVFGFNELSQNIAGYNGSKFEAWQTNANIDLHNAWSALKAVYNTVQAAILPISIFEIKIRVNRKRSKRIEDDFLAYSISLCPDIEKVGENLFQITFDKLTSVANQAFRVLHNNQEPMHYRELLKEINHQLAVATKRNEKIQRVPQRTLIGQLVDDNRFNPIGRSGQWALSEWDHVITQTTVEIMEEFFHKRNSRASIEEIHEYVVTKRPIIPKVSVVAYLYEKEEFTRVSQTEYELTAWGSKQYKPEGKRSQAQDELSIAVSKIFSNQTEQEMLQAELTQSLHGQTGIPKSTITAWLYRTPGIQLKPLPTKKRKNIAIYKGGTNSTTVAPKAHITLMQTVKEEVIEYLQVQPQHTTTIANLALHVMKKTGCKKQTFYNYLDRVEEVTKIQQGNILYCVLQDQEKPLPKTTLQFSQINDIQDNKLQEEIERAVALLSVDTVDVGLFQLGKIFENELKSLLQKAQAVNAFQVTRNDLTRLATMIDCVTRENIIQKKHRLTFLREERNERAHGNISERSEREKLMLDAPFIAGSYIDHIIVFHEKRIEIS